ncbi:IS607 family transposase [Alicyclobacillus sp. ALC3]|nr:IS607 family transposase [Alicyclobacillus sp. ALC3]
MEKTYKPHEFAGLLNVTVRTLQRWDTEGKLKAYRTPTDRRFYTHEQYLECIGKSVTNTAKGRSVIYARVSNQGQKDDLANQVHFLREFVNARGIIVDEVIQEIGSGLNYKRKKWNELLQLAFDGKVSRIFVSHKDRFVRFGFDWFETFLTSRGVEMVIVNNETLSPQEEMVQDLISIIHVFSCRIYGLRKYKKKIKDDPEC